MQTNVTSSSAYTTAAYTYSAPIVLGQAQLGTKLDVLAGNGWYDVNSDSQTYTGYYDPWYSVYWQEGMNVVRHDFKASNSSWYGGSGSGGGGGGPNHKVLWAILPVGMVILFMMMGCCSH